MRNTVERTVFTHQVVNYQGARRPQACHSSQPCSRSREFTWRRPRVNSEEIQVRRLSHARALSLEQSQGAHDLPYILKPLGEQVTPSHRTERREGWAECCLWSWLGESSGPAWSTQKVPHWSGLCSKTLSGRNKAKTSQRSFCLCPQSFGAEGVCHHIWTSPLDL